MRDLIDLIQVLSEASNLAPNEFKNRPERWKTFINKIQTGAAFTTVNGDEVILDPEEADRFQELWDAGQFIGNRAAGLANLAQPYNGKTTISLSQLAKTVEFGGAAAVTGGGEASGGKASYALTPKGIGITNIDIPATDLYETIVNNPVLKSTSHGKMVINLANYIVSGESVTLPPEAIKNSALRAAIQDNAGEYLGVLALLYNRSRFPARGNFEKWLGGTLGDLTIKFPDESNFALADSFGQIVNSKTGHSVNISSKGKDGGAAPAIKGLKIPDHIRKNPKLKNGVAFVDICINEGTLDQAFDGLDLLFKVNPNSISKIWHKYLPFSAHPNIKKKILSSLDGEDVKFDSGLQSVANNVKSSKATDGGKIIYSIKNEIRDAINDRNALPEFRDMVLEILEMNFLQQYCDYEAKHTGELTFATQWPAKLDGEISVTHKSSANDPKSGGMSFKLGRTDDSVSAEPGVDPVDDIESEEDFTTSASDITGEPSIKPRKEKETTARKKR